MIDDVVNAAWELVHEHGLAGLSMRDLGEKVGMHASSIYQYFPSKLDIYDALFAHGHRQLQAVMGAVDRQGDPDDVFRAGSAVFTNFCTEDPVRYQLLFQRTIPDFVPSDHAWEVAQQAYARMATQLARFGVTEPADLDLWTAVLTGLTDQQLSNDPGGDRWERLVDRAVSMLLRELEPTIHEEP